MLSKCIKIWWLCEKTCSHSCPHEWQSTISARKNGSSCLSCSNHSSRTICKHESIVFTHSEIAKEWNPIKNGDLNPENFSYGSKQSIWWINKDCEHEWNATIYSRCMSNSGCPSCINKTEQILYNELIKYYPHLIQQFKVKWCMNKKYLPFDFVLESDKIIIELDGLQHFQDIKFFKSTFSERHKIDLYKMSCAKDNDYSFIRLLQNDVFNNSYDWLSELRTNIDKIRSEKKTQIIYICKNNEYSIFTQYAV